MSLSALSYLVGSGSMSLGAEAAGAQLIGCLENKGYGINAETWKLNRPNTPFGILELDFQSRYFEQYQGLDLIYGNPPCGGLSSMTCSRISSPTNNCMRQWIRMVVHARPRMILMENAYQLATERISPLLHDLTNVLDEAGYWWWTWMFYSYQVGTPQRRKRMFLCASRDRPRNHKFLSLDDLPSTILKGGDCCPCGPILADLIGVAPTEASDGIAISTHGEEITQHCYNRRKIYELSPLIAEHRERLKRARVSDRQVAKLQARAESGEQAAIDAMPRYLKDHWPGMPKEFDGMGMIRPTIIDFNFPAPTVIGYFRYIHPFDDRVLTMREMARLMGYPDSWQFHECCPKFIAQGVPANSTCWAVKRMLKVLDHPEASYD